MIYGQKQSLLDSVYTVGAWMVWLAWVSWSEGGLYQIFAKVVWMVWVHKILMRVKKMV